MTSYRGAVARSKPDCSITNQEHKTWHSRWSGLWALVATVIVCGLFPPSAYAHVGTATITCSQVSYSFDLFPSTGTNIINETVSVDSVVVATYTFQFVGSSASNNLAISVPSGTHTVVAHADWNSNGNSGSFDVTQTVSCNCSGTPPSMASAVADGYAYDIAATLLGAPLIKPPLAPAASSQTGLGTDSHTSGPLVPINLPGPIQVNLLQSSSTSTVTSAAAADESVSTVGTVNLLNLVYAAALRADARAWATPTDSGFSSAGSGIDGLVIAGVAVQSIYPNEVIPLPGGGAVTLLEQTGSTGKANGRSTADLSINLIHIKIPALNTDIVVGHAEAHADAPLQTQCPGVSNGTVSAEAFAAKISQGLIPSLNTIAVNDVTIPSSGGSDSAALQSLTLTLGGKTIGSGTVRQEADGVTSASSAAANATSTVESLCLLTTTYCDPANGVFPKDGIALSAATAATFSSAGGGAAGSFVNAANIAKLSINGTVIDPLKLPPNSTFSIPGLATVIVNEQIAEAGSNHTTDTGLTVNILHVKVLPLGADIIVSSAHTDAHHQ
jgi:hypothetical protein